MAESDRFNLFLLRNFLDAGACANLKAELNQSPTTQAPVYLQGTPGVIHEDVRKTTSLHPSRETVDDVHQKLMRQKAALETHFGLNLTDCEPPQFLRYKKGDFFVRHQDGNTKQLDFDHLRVRRISIVVFLNDYADEPQDDCYGGGLLNFHDEETSTTFGLKGETGLMVAFAAETTHEVSPVTDGERFTLITWFR